MTISVNKHIPIVIDLLLFLMVICFVLDCHQMSGIRINNTFLSVLLMSIIYYVVRLLFCTIPFSFFVLLLVIVCSSLESFWGISQLLGFRHSNHIDYSITGSFDNPGPYGGFIAICVILLVAFCIKSTDFKNETIIHKLFYIVSCFLIITAIVVLPSTQSRSALLALGGGIFFISIGDIRIKNRVKPILRRYGLWIVPVIMVVVTSAYYFKKSSADGRLFMDKICVLSMCSNGLKGAGEGNFGGAYGDAQYEYFKKQIKKKGYDDLDWQAIKSHDRLTAECPDNAFNEFLFIGVEYGPLYLFLFIITIVTAIVISFKRDTIWCYGMLAFALFSLFSYPLHLKQFQILFPVLLAACVSDCSKQEKLNSGIVINAVVFIILITVLAKKIPDIKNSNQAETELKKMERWYRLEDYEFVIYDCEELLPYMDDQRYLFAYGQSFNKIGNYSMSDSLLIKGTKISSDPMFWNVMGNNSLAQGKYREAEERYKHAFYMVPNRLYPLVLLAKLYYTEGDTARFLEMTDVVEKFVPKVESIRTEKLRAEIRELKNSYLSEIEEKNED